jgi:hypothetical protein
LSSKPKCTKLNYVANNHPEDQNKPLIKFCFKQIPSKLKIIQTPAAYLKENKQITQRTPKALEQKKNIKKKSGTWITNPKSQRHPRSTR